MIKLIDILKEIQVNNPININNNPLISSQSEGLKILRNKLGVTPKKINVNIGKYKLINNRYGIEIQFEEGKKLLSSKTINNCDIIFEKLNITPSKIYIEVVPRENGKPAFSYFIYGEYNNVPLVLGRKESTSPAAGQTYLISPTFKDKMTKYLNVSSETIIKNFQLLKELQINNPGQIQVGTIHKDGDGNEFYWMEGKLVLKYLLNMFPDRKTKY